MYNKNRPLCSYGGGCYVTDAAREIIKNNLKEDPSYVPSKQLLFDSGLADEFDKKYPHQLITIRLPNDININTLKRKVNTLSYKYLENGILSIERYSEIGENLHIHILKEGTYSKTKIIRDMSRYWKVDMNAVDVKTGRNENLYNNRVNYVKKEKSTEKKQEFNEKDNIYLEENDLKKFYLL